jgi:ABC-type lipoprotein release transport system permease subunit
LQSVIASELHGVSPLDPSIFAVVPVLLAAVAMLAAWVPARRAAGIDPLAALKHE